MVYIGADCWDVVLQMKQEIELAEQLAFYISEELPFTHARILTHTGYYMRLTKMIDEASYSRILEERRVKVIRALRFCITEIDQLPVRFESFRETFLNRCDELARQGLDNDLMNYYKWRFPRRKY